MAHHSRVKTSTIQLVDTLDIRELENLRVALPKTNLVQVIHVIDEKDIEQARLVSHFVDRLLLDSGNPNLNIKELGGTGRVHDWRLSTEIVKAVDVPVLLAGGLNSDNVGDAINQVRPAGIDVCSGVRTNNHLDVEKLGEFVSKVNRTFNSRTES